MLSHHRMWYTPQTPLLIRLYLMRSDEEFFVFRYLLVLFLSVVICRFLLTFFRTNGTMVNKLWRIFLVILSKNSTEEVNRRAFWCPKKDWHISVQGCLAQEISWQTYKREKGISSIYKKLYARHPALLTLLLPVRRIIICQFSIRCTSWREQ